MRDAAQTVLAWDLKSSSSRSVLLTSCFFAGRADFEQKQTKGTKGRRADGAIAVGCHRPNLALKNSFLRSLLFHGVAASGRAGVLSHLFSR